VRLTLCRQPLVQADGSAYLTIRDLTIENTCNAGIVMRNGRHCRVENCLVRNTGRQGISLSGTHMWPAAAR
jgi:parallel beta-helix repeat protein